MKSLNMLSFYFIAMFRVRVRFRVWIEVRVIRERVLVLGVEA